MDENYQNQSEFENGWMEFEFDSSRTVKEEDIKSVAANPKAEASGEFVWSASGAYDDHVCINLNISLPPYSVSLYVLRGTRVRSQDEQC